MKKAKVADDGMYTVQRILDKRPSQTIAGKYQYLIKWVGWTLSQSTWQPEANLSTVVQMVRQFNKKLDIQKKINMETQKTTKSPNNPKKIQMPTNNSQNTRRVQTPQKNGVKFQKSSTNKPQTSQSYDIQIQKTIHLKQGSFFEPLTISRQQQSTCNQTAFSQHQSSLTLNSYKKLSMQNQTPLIQILTVFNSLSLTQNQNNQVNLCKNIKSCEFVVVYNGNQEIMSRDEIYKLDPQALTKFYEFFLGLRIGNNGGIRKRN